MDKENKICHGIKDMVALDNGIQTEGFMLCYNQHHYVVILGFFAAYYTV